MQATQLIFASNNKGKIKEVQQMAPTGLSIISMREAGIDTDIPEPFDTFRENAHAKASYIKKVTGIDCFAEDSGICVAALGGRPGVFSARYAGDPGNDDRNNEKLLAELKNSADRSAWYQSTICLLWQGGVYYFEGRCEGTILEQPTGSGGFGYDPLFAPNGYGQSFGELLPDAKNSISHRGKAMRQFIEFLSG
ncbi:MAG: RdgB/HAM1 family non-canonical purine NTP pyrophosphatase [Edaphocola sp.]